MIHSLLLTSENDKCNAVRCIVIFTRLKSSTVGVEVWQCSWNGSLSNVLSPSRKLFILSFSYSVLKEAFLQ